MKSWQDIPGYFDYAQTYDNIVEHLACPIKGGILVECGCYLGRSLCYLGQKVKESGKNWKVFGIDNCLGLNQMGMFEREDRYYELLRNVYRCGLEDVITIVMKDSLDAAKDFVDNTISFIFLDTLHTYTNLSQEIEAWLPKIKINGIIGGDDVGLPEENENTRVWPDVKKVVDKYLHGWQYSPHDAWIWWKRG